MSPQSRRRGTICGIFWLSEGIRLDLEAITYNAAKRSLDKQFLDSMWGKSTERNDRTMTKMITEPKELNRFLATPDVEVMYLAFTSYDVVWISWKYCAEEDVPSLLYTNELIGVTSPRGPESTFTATSTGCERTRCILTRIYNQRNAVGNQLIYTGYKLGT